LEADFEARVYPLIKDIYLTSSSDFLGFDTDVSIEYLKSVGF
jgi:hypothetical protein